MRSPRGCGAGTVAASTRPGFWAGVRPRTVQAQPASLDVLLLMDNWCPMTGKAGTRTKWQVAQEWLVAFVSGGRSAGLGLGLQSFPATAAWVNVVFGCETKVID